MVRDEAVTALLTPRVTPTVVGRRHKTGQRSPADEREPIAKSRARVHEFDDRRGAGENHNFQRFFGPVEATI
jgi:hypothetical protein